MKIETAMLIALTVSLGELTVRATVLPADAAFGASVYARTGSGDTATLGYPGSTSATSATAFTALTSGENSSATPSLAVGSSYSFRLSYTPTSGANTADLIFVMTNSAPSQIVSLRENDVYAELVSAKGTSFAQQIGGLSALVFGFNTEQAGLTVSLSDLRLVGATSLSLPASLTFTGTGSSDYVIGNYLFPATGLADGFDLYGTFSSLGNPTGINGIGFQVYAVVPEPATVAFGLAMVGGLGLLEIRRRKIS